MGINGNISGISFGGLSSGIDTDSIISKLVQLEAVPLQSMRTHVGQIQQKQAVLAEFKNRLTALNTASTALSSAMAFNSVKGTSSKTDVASITASSGAAAGIYNLSVSALAQSQKIASAAQTDVTTALNVSGAFVVNGKTVQVDTGDSLTKMAQKINSAGAGVTASVIDGGTGRAYLTIASNASGLKNKVQLADVSGSVLTGLGMLSSAAPTPRETITGGVTSMNFSSQTDTLATMMPNTGITTASFAINGTTVNVDFTTDTLQSLAAKITVAGGGTTGSVRAVTDSAGKTTYKLDISNPGAMTFTDGQKALEAMGVLQRGYSNQLVAAQDAAFTIDGVSLTSSSNSVTTAIPGATITLLKANATTPETSTLTLTKDVDAIKQKIKDYGDAYNNTIDFIKANSQLDKDTFDTGPLFGDPIAQQVESSVSNLVFNTVPSSSGSYHNLSQIGFGVDKDGKLTVDDSKLSDAISASNDNLASLFQTSGTTTGANLSYVYAGSLAKPGTYTVAMTALLQTASALTVRAQTSATQGAETLTFNGTAFGNTPYNLTIPSGSTQTDVINIINGDSKLRTLITASADATQHLSLVSKTAGAAGAFTVVSNVAASANGKHTQIGTSATDITTVTGQDAAGTINGEPATFVNGYLTGNSTNLNTAGLQVQYTGSTLGTIGTVTIAKGVASLTADLMTQFTDPINGLLTAKDKALGEEATDITNNITSLQKRLTEKQAELKLRFSKMEEAISKIQSQSAQLGQIKSLGS